jgi:hypothetical protein
MELIDPAAENGIIKGVTLSKMGYNDLSGSM